MSPTSVCSIDADFIDSGVVGRGILIAQWAQLAVIFTFAVLGTFHTQVTGVKEVGAGLTVIHISLAIALLSHFKGLDHPKTSTILGAMVLDSQNSATLIQMVTKETLASRFQVFVVIPCQVLGLVVEAILVRHFHHHFRNTWSGPEYGKCYCVMVTWRGRLSSCRGTTPKLLSDEMTIFWIYFSCRVVAFIQSSYHALKDTSKFHYAEIKSREKKFKKNLRRKEIGFMDGNSAPTIHPEPQRQANQSDAPKHSTFLGWARRREKKQNADYDEYPTTLSLVYFINSVFSVASMAAVKTAIKKENDIGYLKKPNWSTGQVIAVVVAAYTIVRGIWHFIRIFLKTDGFRCTWLSMVPQLEPPVENKSWKRISRHISKETAKRSM
nr:uncharacterized protein CTRU02_15115 [Colletotrichum truncatum]KAF6781408.1 hypothetical protein CTRU02_15115 [Colletotrichum truncatum]